MKKLMLYTQEIDTCSKCLFINYLILGSLNRQLAFCCHPDFCPAKSIHGPVISMYNPDNNKFNSGGRIIGQPSFDEKLIDEFTEFEIPVWCPLGDAV